MKTKFEHGETALYKEQEVTIQVAQKNFSTQKISYLLTNGQKVEESELTKMSAKGKTINLKEAKNPLADLHAQYEKAFKKPVSNAKKNDLTWITKKLQETGVAPSETTKPGWNVLQALDQASLEIFINEKDIDIDVNDYDNEDDLRVAVAEELNIEVPSQE